MTEGIRSYRDLNAWREAMALAEACNRMSLSFPQEEKFGLTAQLRRSAMSIPANIAEGYGRDANGSYPQFLKVARGSLRELETLLLICERVQIGGKDTTTASLDKCDSVGKLLHGLIRSLRRTGDADR